MSPSLSRKEHGHPDPKKGVTQLEIETAERLVAAQTSTPGIAALLEDDRVLVRMAAESRLWKPDPAGRFPYDEVWETDPELLERVMTSEPYEWVYDGVMQAATQPFRDAEGFDTAMAALVRVARDAPSELRRRLALAAIARMSDQELADHQRPTREASESALRHALLHDESNYNRVEVASAIVDAPYRFQERTVEFARQWLLHTGLGRASKDPGWRKIRGYFSGETQPLLNPEWKPGPPSYPVDGTVPRPGEAASERSDPVPAVHAAAASTPGAPRTAGHVTIEHTKKSIKAQRVLAVGLFAIGFALLFVDTEYRFQLAFTVMAAAVVWFLWLRLLRWWEHA